MTPIFGKLLLPFLAFWLHASIICCSGRSRAQNSHTAVSSACCLSLPCLGPWLSVIVQCPLLLWQNQSPEVSFCCNQSFVCSAGITSLHFCCNSLAPGPRWAWISAALLSWGGSQNSSLGLRHSCLLGCSAEVCIAKRLVISGNICSVFGGRWWFCRLCLTNAPHQNVAFSSQFPMLLSFTIFSQ